MTASYIARPPSDSGRPVLLLHAWWGLNQPIRDLADRLAVDGFTVLAPDLFDGVVVTTVEDAEAHGQTVEADYRPILAKVDAALDALLAEPAARGERVAIAALSFGGWYAAQIAKSRPEVAALIEIYSDIFEATGRATYQGHHAEVDAFRDASTEPALQAAVERGAAFVYPGTQHWFMESDRPEYDADATDLAMRRIVTFLRQQLEPGGTADARGRVGA